MRYKAPHYSAKRPATFPAYPFSRFTLQRTLDVDCQKEPFRSKLQARKPLSRFVACHSGRLSERFCAAEMIL